MFLQIRTFVNPRPVSGAMHRWIACHLLCGSFVTERFQANRASIHQTVSQPAETSWPITGDNVYHRRPPNGVLYYRDYNGNLVNQNVTGVQDLGAKIAARDDMYICAAKRYYEYFTGISVDTGDIKDPLYPNKLTADDTKHRNFIIQLGKNFKSHQNPRTLIKAILESPQYKRSNFEIP